MPRDALSMHGLVPRGHGTYHCFVSAAQQRPPSLPIDNDLTNISPQSMHMDECHPVEICTSTYSFVYDVTTAADLDGLSLRALIQSSRLVPRMQSDCYSLQEDLYRGHIGHHYDNLSSESHCF